MTMTPDRLNRVKYLAQVLAGCVGAALLMLLVGFCLLLLCRNFFPLVCASWAAASALTKTMIMTGVNILLVVSAGLLWKRRQALAVGILVYACSDTLHLLYVIITFAR
jgi:hypothetical protein